jgi:hypothetical protein
VRPMSASDHAMSLGLGFALVLALLGVSPLTAVAAGCPNEALRTELRSGALPECRAYELASPTFRAGFPLTVHAKTADGSHLIYQSLGAAPGAESNPNVFGGLLEASRLSTGWMTTALSPPATQFASSEYLLSSSGLSRSLWQLHTRDQSFFEMSLYLREPGGNFVEVGPEGYPPALAGAPNYEDVGNLAGEYGAAANLSRVVFDLPGTKQHNPLWPGDTTIPENFHSLYEYSGTGNAEPKLVAVTNSGPLASDTEAQLIGDCGTELGGGFSGSTDNSVSEDGHAVFFTVRECDGSPEDNELRTPEVNELYARLNGERTVDISEPSPQDCAECITTPGARAPGVFQGASTDGTRVFFTSEQELLPGATGKNLYEYDFSAPEGQRVRLISAGASPARVRGVTRISPDGSHLYYVARGVLTEEPNGEGETASAGSANMYLFQRDAEHPQGHTSFVATVVPSEEECEALEEEGLEETCSEDESLAGRDQGRPATITADGRFLLFATSVDLTPDDTSKVAQLFRYDAITGTLVRVSTGQEGFNDNGNTDVEADTPAFKVPHYQSVFSPAEFENTTTMSEDGSYVTFYSAGALTPRALAGHRNVYLWHEGQVSLISDGQDSAVVEGAPAVFSYGMSTSGSDVFFTTASALIPQDVNTQLDLYDARIDGGFAMPATAPGCSEAGCRGPLPSPPGLPTAGSVTQPAGEDLTPAPESVTTKAKAKPLTRAQKLTRALRACRVKHNKGKRAACEAQARKRYGAQKHPRPSHRQSKPRKSSRRSK